MNNWNNDSEYSSQLREISRANDRIAPVLQGSGRPQHSL